jgi:hypothetical protein
MNIALQDVILQGNTKVCYSGVWDLEKTSGA